MLGVDIACKAGDLLGRGHHLLDKRFEVMPPRFDRRFH